ncbi:calcium channel protein [Actinomortierella ambigua]|nr:calcium channel protein [Actinomortierella ambigua]
MDRPEEEDKDQQVPVTTINPSNTAAGAGASSLPGPRLPISTGTQHGQDPNFLLIPREQTPSYHSEVVDYVEELNSPSSPFLMLVQPLASGDDVDRRSVSSSGKSSVASSTLRRRRPSSPANQSALPYTQHLHDGGISHGDSGNDALDGRSRALDRSDGVEKNNSGDEQDYLLKRSPAGSVASSSRVSFAPTISPLVRQRSIASRSSTSSRNGQRSRAASAHQIVTSPPTSDSTSDHSQNAGWIAGFSEIMADISSRVVNTRSQENINRRSLHSNGSIQDVQESDSQARRSSSHGIEAGRSTSVATLPMSPELPPWVRSAHVSEPGSDPSNSFRHSVSGQTSSSSIGSPGMKPMQPGGSAPTSRPSGSQHGDAGHGQPKRGLLQSSEPPKPISASTGIMSGGVGGDRTAAGDEESVFIPGGFSHRGNDAIVLEGYSLKLFAPDNQFRQWLASILVSKYVDPLILVVILAQWVFLVITPTTPAAKNDFGTYWTQYALLAVNIFYTLEIIAKSIVYGFIFDSRGFVAPRWLQKMKRHLPKRWFQEAESDANALRARRASTASQTLDLVVVISYWIDFAFMMTGVREIYVFKAISALRPFRLLSLTEGTATILYSLSIAAPLLVNILIFICFFLMILGLIGLLVFSGSLSRRCAIQQEGEPGVWIPASPEVLCGGYYSNGTVLGIVNYIGQGDGDDSSPRTSGRICPEGQICMQFPSYNPELGFVSFDNIFYSLLTVFTVSSMEGWTDVEYWVMDGDSRFAAVYFCIAIFLMSFLMIPLFIAGITYSFGAVRAEKRHSAFTSRSIKKRTLLDTEEGWQFEDQIRQVRSPLRMWLIKIVSDPWFVIFGAFLVFCDLLAMCFRRYDSSSEAIMLLDRIELAFTMIFLAEILLRIAGHANFGLFLKKKSNAADLIIAIVTTVILLPPIYRWRWYPYLTVFQVLRAYRLVQVIPPIRDLIAAVMGSARGMMNLLLITFMFLLVCAPVPMILFGGDMTSESPQPINFDDLGQSFIALFIILTGENWVEVMYEGLDAHRDVFPQTYGIIFFIGYYCLSHYVLLNLFIAIVLEQFELDDDEKYKKQLEMYFQRHQRKADDDSTVIRRYFNPYSYLPARPQTLTVRGLPTDQTATIRKSVFWHFMEDDVTPDTSKEILSQPWLVVWYERIKKSVFPATSGVKPHTPESPKLNEKAGSGDPQSKNIQNVSKVPKDTNGVATGLDNDLLRLTRDIQDPSTSAKTMEIKDPSAAPKDDSFRAEAKDAELNEFLEAHPMYDRSLFLFPSNNRFRQWCKRLVGPRVSRKLVDMNRFNWFIFLCIIVSIVIVIIDDPKERREAELTGNSREQKILLTIDHVTTFIFVVEQALRIIAYGLLLTPTGYIRNFWNLLDLAITALSATMFFVEIDHLYQLSRAIRAMYCLRVLRIIRYFEGMSAMFLAITKALPKMLVALLLTAMLFWPFAIYGVNIYAGYFYFCNDLSVSSVTQCWGEFMSEPGGDDNSEILMPRVWSNPYEYSFDNAGAAILTLFEMASQEGWVSVMKSGRAVPNRLGEQPYFVPDEPNRFNSFYFLLVMLIGSIIFVQIFIGVILETFKKWNGISLLTVEQRRWIDLRRQLRLINPTTMPQRPVNRFRAWCFDMARAKKGLLWNLITLVLVLNVLLIASQHYDQPSYLTDIQDISYFIFLGVYASEILIKISGYGFRKWRHSRWNLYDMAITVLAIATLIPRFTQHALWTSRLEKFLLITISFRLAQRIDALQVLFRALIISMRSIINITGVFMVVMFVYAIMFRELFGMTRLGPSTTPLANFETFGSTILMLIRMTTGENWDFVMHDMMVEPPECTPSQQNYLDSDCGSRVWAYIMFLSFYIVCTYILLNMFIAVIISNFSFAYQSDSISTLITREDLRNYKLTWAKFDPHGTGYLQPKDLSMFLRSLNGRLCLRVYESPELSIPNLVAQHATTLQSGAPPPVASGGGQATNHSSQGGEGEGTHTQSNLFQSTSAAVRRLTRVSGSPRLGAVAGGAGNGSPQLGAKATGSRSSPHLNPIEEKQRKGSVSEKGQGRLDLDTNCIDIPALEETLSKISSQVVRRRRLTLNMVYTEAMMMMSTGGGGATTASTTATTAATGTIATAATSTRGISFHSILDILSYTFADIEQSLGMDEFLKRNERVKEIQKELASETINNLLQTIILRRKFLRHRSRSRQRGVRQRPEVPRIVIDTSLGGNDRTLQGGDGRRAGRDGGRDEDTSPMLTSASPSGNSSLLPSPILDFSRGRSVFQTEEGSPVGGGGGAGNSSPLSRTSLERFSWDSPV